VNNVTAVPNEDDSVTVRFGDPDPTAPNRLSIVPGWNYVVRLYRPPAQILDSTWTFPTAEPVPH
jgi:hypothetical protein